MAKLNKRKIPDNYDTWAMLSMIALLILFFYFAFSFWSTGKEQLRVAKVIEYANDTSTIMWTPVLKTSITETNRYYNHIIKLRKSKLEKLKYWSEGDNTKLLNKYKKFYDIQISKNWELDYKMIASEMAWIWDKVGVRILGISLWSPQLSRNVEFTQDNRYDIYERPVTIDIAKVSDEEFKKDSIYKYDHLKRFLEELRNDVKMPYNLSFEVAKQSETEDWYEEWNIKFDRVNLLFFYNFKK